MKTKLLRKIRKEYEILYYPNGSKAVGDSFQHYAHYEVNQKIKLNFDTFTRRIYRTRSRKTAYDRLIEAIRNNYGTNKKGKFKGLW